MAHFLHHVTSSPYFWERKTTLLNCQCEIKLYWNYLALIIWHHEWWLNIILKTPLILLTSVVTKLTKYKLKCNLKCFRFNFNLKFWQNATTVHDCSCKHFNLKWYKNRDNLATTDLKYFNLHFSLKFYRNATTVLDCSRKLTHETLF